MKQHLYIGNKLFFAQVNMDSYGSATIREILNHGKYLELHLSATTIAHSTVYIDHPQEGDFFKGSYNSGNYVTKYVITPLESKIIRYCKAQGFKHLMKLNEEAQKAINKIVEYRQSNYDNLNCKWTEHAINELRKAEQHLLYQHTLKD